MKAMILAAGRGQRMRPLTDEIPKPLLKIGEKTLIEYHLYALAKAGFKEIIVNIAFHPQQFLKLLGDGSRYGVHIHYSMEPENEPLDTGGGIFQALPLLGSEPFLVISADLWTRYPLEKLPQTLAGLAHIVLVSNPDHNPQGDFCLVDGKVIVEGKDKLNFGGIGIYHPKLFAECQPGKFSYVPLLIDAMAKKLVTGEHYQGIWYNIGTVVQLQNLNAQMEKLKEA